MPNIPVHGVRRMRLKLKCRFCNNDDEAFMVEEHGIIYCTMCGFDVQEAVRDGEE